MFERISPCFRSIGPRHKIAKLDAFTFDGRDARKSSPLHSPAFVKLTFVKLTMLSRCMFHPGWLKLLSAGGR